MAGILKPNDVGGESTHKVWGESLYDPSANLFDGSYTTPARPYSYWSAAGQYLDIEFFEDIRIHDAGGSTTGYANSLKIYKNDNGVKGVYVKDLTSNLFSATPNWTMVAELPKGRYRIEYGVGVRISNQWFIEQQKPPSTDKILLLSEDENKTKKIKKGKLIEKNLIPYMTSVDMPYGKVTSSIAYAWEIFSEVGSSNGGGIWRAGDWISYEFEKPVQVLKYEFKSNPTSINPFTRWRLDGSVDGLDWVVLDEVSKEATATEAREFKNRQEYKHYRMTFLTVRSSSYTRLYRLELYGLSSNIITSLPSQSEQSFINHGMSLSDLASIDMSAEFTEKHYIQDVSTPLGKGKVFRQALDINKVIKKVSIK